MGQQRRHILYITPGFAKSESDTSSVTYFLNYLKAFKKKNPDSLITIIALDYPFEQSQYQWFGSTVYSFGLYKKNKLQKLKTALTIRKLVLQIHKKQPIHIVHSLWLKQASLLGQYLAKKLGVTSVLTAMGMEFLGNNPYLRWIDTKYSSIVFVSKKQIQLGSLSLGIQEEVIIPWGVVSQENLKSRREIDILFVGYLNKNKNLQLALEIINNLLADFNNLKTTIVGDYFNVDYWKSVTAEMGLTNNVSFTGMIDNGDVIDLMKSSKILLHTSDYESLGYAMLEALSCGTYVVSKDVGIAKQSNLWKIAESKSDFESIIKQLLNQYETARPEIPITLEDTVIEYSKLYDI